MIELHDPKISTFFAVTKNSDSIEGKGHTIQLGHFQTQEMALACAKDKRYAQFCVQGYHDPARAHYDVVPVTLTIYDSPDSFFALHSREAARQRALAKLTKEEQKILGLI